MVSVGLLFPGEIFVYNKKNYIRIFSEKKGYHRFFRKRYAKDIAALDIQTGNIIFFGENSLVERKEGKRLEVI